MIGAIITLIVAYSSKPNTNAKYIL